MPGLPKRQRTAAFLLLQLLHLLPRCRAADALDSGEQSHSRVPELTWPAPVKENCPWTRWWWMGSAVDTTNLTRLIEEYHNAGIGGVEICPIYGAKGYEDRFIEFLTPKWMQMLTHTSREAKRLGVGLDLTTGTGWPFGGPNVTPEMASAKVVLKKYELAAGEKLKPELPEGKLQCLMVFSDAGERKDLTGKVVGRHLDWIAPEGKWRLYAVFQSGPAQKVKRAAPGGEGNVLDPYSVTALNKYLARFDEAFRHYEGQIPRAQFHDSFEYYGAQWTPAFFKEFKRRRGYDLQTELPAFSGEGAEDRVARVKGDYRETISDLHLAYIERWTQWCHSRGSLSRDQAHGSPGNLVDIYAAADIPETEIFGAPEESHIAMNKFSSSAAHIAEHNLASSESFTWLTEHFQASLSQIKQAADYLFLSGVNHIFFHGIPYSPADAPWPGWQFYAAVNFGPQGGLWHDLPEFNAYVTRCQSILQGGQPDNDLLVYYPVHDVWNSAGDLIRPNPIPTSFTNSIKFLWERGYAFDYVSDRYLTHARSRNHEIELGGNHYRAVFVPECSVIPAATMKRLIQLARSGATILFQDHVPSDVPGWKDIEKRRADLNKLLKSVRFVSQDGVLQASPGSGSFLVASNLTTLMSKSAARRESWVETGLRFVRRRTATGFDYFVANRSDRSFQGWIPFSAPFASAVILDPRAEDRAGVAMIRAESGERETVRGSKRRSAGASERKSLFLQLEPGESCVVRLYTKREVAGPPWRYLKAAGKPQELTGEWNLKFIEGGPNLPADTLVSKLDSWTESNDPETKRFAGTGKYSLEFELPPAGSDDWLLDLGKVCDSARVRINGRVVHGFWCAPFKATVGKWLRPGKNLLEVEVTNLAANRIADLDRRKVKWKYFYDINMASKRYRSFDASDWPVRDSGLLGPVTLTPMANLKP